MDRIISIEYFRKTSFYILQIFFLKTVNAYCLKAMYNNKIFTYVILVCW